MNFNATFIGQIVVFAVFVWICAKFVWPPIMEAMQARQKKIAEGLDSADRAAKDLELAKHEAEKQLSEAKKEAAAILEQANKRATQLVDEAKVTAREEGDRIVASAQAEVDKEVTAAREQLRERISELTLAGAERILGSEVDAKKHSELLDKLAAEL
ncbi:F0F1 ATP synthase subunit B [Saccharospirillum sp. MSK14-1]|uniref:F0F1 ATP synthase subunit B n=1 Tax=Saccharospirillum sp. MSK14-1 TaxID=1897632 RepID=UPI000D386DC4|nr:F0F1 ATP synthase subunit B [Saccharospirillum sp. MSK14-1]PTY37374.1 F0F1 ATP synthase subunit B [Saccharospirillum sp. MSK14-1]